MIYKSKGKKKKERQKYNTNPLYPREISFSNMPIDPNEPRYCYCQRVSFGEMVACDNPGVSQLFYCVYAYT